MCVGWIGIFAVGQKATGYILNAQFIDPPLSEFHEFNQHMLANLELENGQLYFKHLQNTESNSDK